MNDPMGTLLSIMGFFIASMMFSEALAAVMSQRENAKQAKPDAGNE